MSSGIVRAIVEEALREKRRFRRVRLNQNGRAFIPANDEEAPCIVSDISVGGANVSCRLAQAPTGAAVVYVGGLGRLEGRILSWNRDGFAMEFMCSRLKREKLADLLTVEINRHLLNGEKEQLETHR